MRKSALLAFVLLLMPHPAYADIVVGVAGPMGGQNAVFGEQMKVGVQAAIEAANAEGGINGEQLVMSVGDDACDSRRAVTVAEDFVRQDARVVIGHFCSGATIAASKTYQQAGILVISPSATGPAVTDGGFWNVLRVANRDDRQADLAAARIAKDDGNARVAIINDGQSAGRALASRMKERVPSSLDVAIKAGVSDQSAAITAMREAGTTAVYFTTAATDAGNISAALRAADVKVRVYGPDTLLSDVFHDRAKESADGALATFTTDPVSLVAPVALQDTFVAKGLAIDGAVVPSYAAVEAFVAAAKARDVNDGRTMADWLTAGNTVKSIMGELRFDGRGDVQPQRFTWYRWSGEEFVEDQSTN